MEIREKLGYKVVLEHVRSDQDTNKSEKISKKFINGKKKDKKYENMFETFREINKIADEEANKARNTKLQPIKELTKGMPMVVLRK